MITGLSRPIKDFLRQDRQYLIPRYQREYVWEEKQWDDLFDDLLKNYKKHNESPAVEAHFIGSIVILEEKKDRYSMANVIDGQQRLTTFFVLMLAIMRTANIYGQKDLFEGVRDYLKTKSSIGEKYDKFANEDNPYFKLLLDNCATYTENVDTIIDNQDIEKRKYDFQEKFINRCFLHMFNRIEGCINTRTIDLKEFTSRIMETVVIETISTNVSESYTIFEILNARGKQLENHELIKNYIMRYYEPTDCGDVALKDWKTLIDILKKGGVKPRNFFDHYASHKYDRSKEKKGQAKLSTYDYIVQNEQENSKKLLDDFISKAKLYVIFNKPNSFDFSLNQHYQRISDGLKFFKGRSKTQFRPLFLSLFNRLYDPNVTVENIQERDGSVLSDIIYFLEKFFFVYGVVLKCQNKPLEKIVHKYAFLIENCDFTDLEEIITNLKIDLSMMLPDYVTFENAFCNLGYSRKNVRYLDENGNKDDVKYILSLYERYLRKNTRFDESFSIEHVHKDTGNDIYCKIGNLICLDADENSRLGTKPASAKMPTYRISQFETAKKIAADYNGKWEQTQIELRGKEIAKILYYDIWEVEPKGIA